MSGYAIVQRPMGPGCKKYLIIENGLMNWSHRVQDALGFPSEALAKAFMPEVERKFKHGGIMVAPHNWRLS